MNNYLDILPEVREALLSGKPVVALESTIIAQGMPYPENVSTAKKLSQTIRDRGAMPATIAIIKGRIKVGLELDDLTYIGKSESVIKVSRRDLPFIIAQQGDGATTVASTMIIAALAGIKVFVTGGIGGVHRGADKTMDISADLMELARTNVAVICAGVKSVLDIGLTLEYLETHGVPVLGYQTSNFPAFYLRNSGFGVDRKIDSPEVLAKVIKTKWELGLNGGVVIGNPVPIDHEMDEDTINKAIEDALKEANTQQVSGKEITPFLLSKIKSITEGKSLETNIALVLNNARLGADLAKAMS
uniref:pseudouridine-5'-phosphate glycosidase n=1 Tax=Limibacter armeniacum TaxID=466084 RepID=UPI0038CC0140